MDSLNPEQERASADLEQEFSYSIESLVFSDGSAISLSKGETVLIVGGNNAGKSQALREIVKQLDSETAEESSCVVVKKVAVSVNEDEQALRSFVKQLEKVPGSDSNVGRMGMNMRAETISMWLKDPKWLSKSLRRGLRAFTTYLIDTQSRLEITQAIQSIDFLREQKRHPLHYLADDIELEDQISAVFKKAFGMDLVVNRTVGSHVHLHTGQRPSSLATYNVDKEMRNRLGELPRLDEQGDGMKAFVGCLMWGTVVDYNILLIDEPEAFLHPPQARLLGRTLVKQKKVGTQLLLATHSGDFLRGALDAGASHLRILRLVRQGTNNVVSELRPEDVVALSTDSLLRQTNVLDALFHQLTVVCESDADAQFYSALTSVLADASETRPTPDVLFLQSGGINRMPAIVGPLRKIGVPIRVVTDFDVLREEKPLRPIFEALGGQWSEIEADWKVLQAAVSARKAQLDKADLVKAIDSSLRKVHGEVVPDSALKEIKDAARKASAWAYAKTGGESFLPAGDVFNRYVRLRTTFKSVGLYIVPKGELESFCKSVADHGPAWVEQVCKKNLGADPELRDAREFVEALIWPPLAG